MVGSHSLRRGDVCSWLEFFISFYGLFEQVLVVAKRSNRFLTSSLERVIEPNIALLLQCGVRDISKLTSISPKHMKEVLLQAEELRVPPALRMFRHVVAVLARNSKEEVAAKLEFFKRTLGCSELELSIAVSKKPAILGFFDEILLRKIEFLVNEAAVEPRYIVERPVLLTYSLEKWLVPRHYVMKVLKQKGLLSTNMSLYSLASYGEETFKSKFINCHEDSVPGLADAYATARAGIVPSRV
jgi:mTERF domain-containing protein